MSPALIVLLKIQGSQTLVVAKPKSIFNYSTHFLVPWIGISALILPERIH